jgi:hypothetical protein
LQIGSIDPRAAAGLLRLVAGRIVPVSRLPVNHDDVPTEYVETAQLLLQRALSIESLSLQRRASEIRSLNNFICLHVPIEHYYSQARLQTLLTASLQRTDSASSPV